MTMKQKGSDGYSRRKILKSSAGLGAAALSGFLPSLTVHADTPTLNMWWWGEQELPGLQAFVDDSVKNYTAASVKTMLQDTAVVISQFQTAAAAGNAPDIQYLWNGIYHMESVWLGYLRPLNGLVNADVLNDSRPTLLSHFGDNIYRLGWYPLPMIWCYNKDLFDKAGLDADKPPKTWPEVFEAAKKLKAAGHTTCGFSNAWVTWVNVEQLSAWHNVPLATRANGMDGFDTELKINSPLHVKHLQNLVDLQKDKTYDYSGRTNTGEGRFTSGECPIMLTSSAFFGNIRANAKFDYANAPMPYYPDVAGAPQNSIIGGASLWVMGGKSAQEYKGVARFFTFLSDTDRQLELHTKSGYMPITKAAYEKAKATGVYKQAPYMETPLLELANKEPTENSRGLRFGNMVQLRDVWAEEFEAALNGKKTAQQALDDAVARGNQMLRQFERTVSR
jgi:ABC-type glycerol-3-phosphate transport system substrate-binding protein